jgi:hypothetical protein
MYLFGIYENFTIKGMAIGEQYNGPFEINLIGNQCIMSVDIVKLKIKMQFKITDEENA